MSPVSPVTRVTDRMLVTGLDAIYLPTYFSSPDGPKLGLIKKIHLYKHNRIQSDGPCWPRARVSFISFISNREDPEANCVHSKPTMIEILSVSHA